MSDSPVMSLMLKLASIQKKTEELKRSRSRDWLKIVRLQQLRLKLMDRLYHVQDMAFRMTNIKTDMSPVLVHAHHHRMKHIR